MGTKNKYLWVIPIVVIGLVFAGCPKECVSPARSYEQYVYFSPVEKVLSVGDTLWVESTFRCDSLHNLLTNRIESFCEAKYGFPMSMDYLVVDGDKKLIYAADSFDYKIIYGEAYSDPTANPIRVKQVFYEKIGNIFVLKLGLIPKTTGYFAVWTSNVGAYTDNHCDRAGVSYQPANEDRHLEIYAKYRGEDAYTHISKNGYFFQVK